MLDNDPRYFEIVWGASRCGLYYTPVGRYLHADEAGYIIRDCGARIVFLGRRFLEIAARLVDDGPELIVLDADGGDARDYESLLPASAASSASPDAPVGSAFFYSSGTTGRPKGIRRGCAANQADAELRFRWREPFGFGADTVYLSPAPLHHAAPLSFSIFAMMRGGSVVVMSRFDPAGALASIERHKVTHSQWVPTMFFRMLALPEAVRGGFDLASHRCAIHAAAPCPVEIKGRMIAWWGPIVWEYYGGSEGNGVTLISSGQWLVRKGSVGKAVVGVVHILGEDGRELAPGEIGDVYFDGPAFAYHNDPEKTARSRSPQGWTTLGDVGYLDAEGYLYLTDRRAYTIISGGVNIYPAEIENVLALHPAVRDVAVFGIPNAEFGEEVKAAVELVDPGLAGADTEHELIAYCRDRLAHYKCPRSVDFHPALPRQETGKLLKHALHRHYVTR
jgi:long-chain acyl-CoA synthetase